MDNVCQNNLKRYNMKNRGSEWHKWDLHVHTPMSGLSNNFHCTWDDYVKRLFESAIANNIVAIGITDYFLIDGYKFLKHEYLENVDKLKTLFNDEQIKQIKSIAIFPNIEFRLDSLVNGNRVNYHVLFSDEVDIKDIEENFLTEIDFSIDEDPSSCPNRRKLSKTNLEELGKKITIQQPSIKGSNDFETGCKIAVVNRDRIVEVLNKHKDIFEGKYVTIVPVDEDLSNISWDGQGHMVRKLIYQSSDMFFATNPNTIEFGLGRKSSTKKEFIAEFKSLKPCIRGCDAHSLETLFQYPDNHACWIKAVPSFFGLKQIIFEPETRVKIQPMAPDQKPDRMVISEIKFIDSSVQNNHATFSTDSLYLNSNLNSIIGGKSSGKSLLLHSIAEAVDKQMVERVDGLLKVEGYSRSFNHNFMVKWNDGLTSYINDVITDEDNRRKVTYIPQLYINYLAEKENKEDLNSLLLNILKQNDIFRKEYEEYINDLDKYKNTIATLLTNMFATRQEAISYKNQIKDIGNSKEIESSITKIKESIKQLAQQSTLLPKEQEIYYDYLKYDENCNKELAHLQLLSEIAEKIQNMVSETTLGMIGNGEFLQGKIDGILEYDKNRPQDFDAIFEKYKKDLETSRDELDTAVILYNLEGKINTIKNQKAEKEKEIKGILEKIQFSKQLMEFQKVLVNEGEKLVKSTTLEDKYRGAVNNYKDIKGKITSQLLERIEKQKAFVNNINTKYSQIYQDVSLKASIENTTSNCYFYMMTHKLNARSVQIWKEMIPNDEYINTDLIPVFFDQCLRIDNGNMLLRDNSQKLEKIQVNNGTEFERYMRSITDDVSKINFNVQYKGDNLLQMSPGKKGTVLLILFLQLNSAEYPILIDQPEDNLDNRTIYELLCSMIKEKKRSRQIILVSHNANIVVSTDSENVIVANQYGQDESSRPYKSKFEYINGALENTFDKSDNKNLSELTCKGIREHVCDVLEGGESAFLQREQKYGIKYGI